MTFKRSKERAESAEDRATRAPEARGAPEERETRAAPSWCSGARSSWARRGGRRSIEAWTKESDEEDRKITTSQGASRGRCRILQLSKKIFGK